jgi:hypothetical protein
VFLDCKTRTDSKIESLKSMKQVKKSGDPGAAILDIYRYTLSNAKACIPCKGSMCMCVFRGGVS